MAWVALVVGLVLLFLFPKQMGAVIAIAIAAGAGLYLYTQHQDRLSREERDRVVVRVEYGADKECPASQPLRVFVGNSTDRTVTKIEFQLEIRQPGYSNNLIQGYGSGSFKTDRILKPKEGYSLCYSAPKLRGNPPLTDLEYSIARKDVTFAN